MSDATDHEARMRAAHGHWVGKRLPLYRDPPPWLGRAEVRLEIAPDQWVTFKLDQVRSFVDYQHEESDPLDPWISLDLGDRVRRQGRMHVDLDGKVRPSDDTDRDVS